MPANFQTDNKKYKRKSSRVNVNNPDFNSPVELVTGDELLAIKEHIEQWKDFISFFRWYPDLYYDLIKPESGRTIRLGIDQRMMLRCLARFKSTYGVLPRGSGKTMISMMCAIHTCIFYPNVQVALTAQTKENSAKLIKDKYDELIDCFPVLREEIYSVKFSVNDAEIEFHNGSRIC